MTIATDLKVILQHFAEELIEVVITNSVLTDQDDNNTVYGIAVGVIEAQNLNEVLKQTLRDILQPNAKVVGRMVTTEDSDDDCDDGDEDCVLSEKDLRQAFDNEEERTNNVETDYEGSAEEEGLDDLEDEENYNEEYPYSRDEDYLD